MTFDREIIEEQLALNMIHPPQKLARDVLEAGYDGRFIAASLLPTSRPDSSSTSCFLTSWQNSVFARVIYSFCI
jgi:hypothetical protein